MSTLVAPTAPAQRAARSSAARAGRAAGPGNLLARLAFRVSCAARAMHANLIWRAIVHLFSRPLTATARPAIVIAPHQDDESLGCGGMIALKRRLGARVTIVFLTDGASSPVADARLVPSALVPLRVREAAAAVRVLGVPPEDVHFLGQPDGNLSAITGEARRQLIEELADHVRASGAEEVYVPHRRDAHPDHEAAFALARDAVAAAGREVQVLQYSVWMAWLLPLFWRLYPRELRGARRLSVRDVIGVKCGAVGAYASQIAMFPRGFLERFLWNHELYFPVQTDGVKRRVANVLFLHRDCTCTSGVTRCITTFLRHRRRDAVVRPHVGAFAAPEPAMARLLADLDTPTLCIGERGGLSSLIGLRRYLRGEGIDVVLACSFKSYLLAKLAAVGTRCAVACWVHGVQQTIEGRWKERLFAWLARRDTLVFVSDFVRRAKTPTGHRGTAAVVYNGAADTTEDPDQAPYPRAARSALGLPGDAFVIGYVAEMIGWKDHATLLRAFDRLVTGPEGLPDAHLVLIGTGVLHDQIRAAAAASPAAERIHLLGARPDARRLLGLIDVYAHTCRGEGFGLAAVEAMLAGKPVVGAADGALPEYLEENVTGLLFSPGDDATLAAKLRWVHDHPEDASRLADEARRRCRARFSPRRYADELTDLLRMTAGSAATSVDTSSPAGPGLEVSR